ncbi:hypothetical protein KEM55_004402, partial [Ascosphaera atra]
MLPSRLAPRITSFTPLRYLHKQLYKVPARALSTTLNYRSAEMKAIDTTSRLASLRELMRERSLDLYVIPSEDAHQSEYIAECDARRAYITGFTGSAGIAVVTMEKAAMETDG